MPAANWPTVTSWPGGSAWPSGSNWPLGFTPAALPNLVLWVDARTQTYSDAGGTVAANPYSGRVRRINFPAPLSGNAQAISDALRPWREPNTLNCMLNAGHYLAATAASACVRNDFTIALSFRMRDNTTSAGQFLFANDAGGAYVYVFNSNLLVMTVGGYNWNIAAVPAGASCALVVRTTPTLLKASLVVNGTRTDYTLPVVLSGASVPAATWTIGADGRVPIIGIQAAISQAIAAARSVSEYENNELLGFLASAPAPDFATALRLVVLSGDSIAAGLNLDRALIWSFKAQQAICTASPLDPINLLNCAVSGDTIAMQEADYPTTMAPFYSAARAKNIFMAAVGTNNMANIGQDGPTALAAYYAYLDDKLARGWRVIACTVLPRAAGGAFNTARAYFNSNLRADWAGRGYSAIADVALVPGMGADGDELNATNYMDTVHPTLVGNDLLEPTYRAAIQAV